MIVTRTPFRVTLGGGGTDLPSYYEQHGGFIFAMGLDKYMYVMLNRGLVDRLVRLHYTKSETVAHVSALQHELAREALLRHGIESTIEISSLADLPAGTGVGSSSCYLVGLLTAIREYLRRPVPLHDLAEEACDIELRILKKPIGKQDQYMAVYSGMTVLEIAKDGQVAVKALRLSSGAISDFVANTHIYYTGVRRDALDVLASQDQALKKAENASHAVVVDSLHRIKELGYRILNAISAENFDEFGALLDEHWQNKKRMSSKISLGQVDTLYDQVRRDYGVLGGKIIGAGGGGFLMLYCPGRHRELTKFMEAAGMPRLRYNLEFQGSKVVTNLLTVQDQSVTHVTPDV
jgi:D-glycero-alpha-D-manno-heptose-7-phosphate kinase